MNPWKVQSIQDFNFFCCPECVYRSKEEISFQIHALQNHPQSEEFFHGFIIQSEETQKIEIKDEPPENELNHTHTRENLNDFLENVNEIIKDQDEEFRFVFHIQL